MRIVQAVVHVIFCHILPVVMLWVLFLALLTSDDRAERGMCTTPHARKSSLHSLHVPSEHSAKTQKAQTVGFPSRNAPLFYPHISTLYPQGKRCNCF